MKKKYIVVLYGELEDLDIRNTWIVDEKELEEIKDSIESLKTVIDANPGSSLNLDEKEDFMDEQWYKNLPEHVRSDFELVVDDDDPWIYGVHKITQIDCYELANDVEQVLYEDLQ